MTYTFRCKAARDIEMIASAGDAVLVAIGIAPASDGIVHPADLPAALAAMQAAVLHDQATTGRNAATRNGDVSLRQSAWPFVQMMRHALDAGEPIEWST